MRRKHLESALSSVRREFPNPNILLEQYPTSPELTAAVIITALENEDVGPGRSILDLGCGTGMLTLACALVESDFVIGIDCDADALVQAQENIVDMELENTTVSLLLAKVKGLGLSVPKSQKGSNFKKRGVRAGGRGRGRPAGRENTAKAMEIIMRDDDGIPIKSKSIDTVLLNPPFGTKGGNAGMDVRFLRCATRVARRAVYSFHKSSTREFLLKTLQQWGHQANVVAEMKFDLPRSYKFHKEANVDVNVDLIRVEVAVSDNNT